MQSESSSEYRLKHKYECMVDPKNDFPIVELSDEASECLLEHFEYAIENCLTLYETRFNFEMGFTGGNGTVDDPLYYTIYSNLTQDLVEKREADAMALELALFEASGNNPTQVSTVEVVFDITDDLIQEYLCNETSMYFYTNPYDDSLQDPTA